MVNWLIEESAFHEEGVVESLIREIQAQGMQCKLHHYVPFEGSNEYLKLFNDDDCVVFYGSLQFARQINRQAPWIPGIYCDLDKYKCTYYYPRFGDYLLNNNYIMMPYGELKRRMLDIHQIFTDYNNDRVFIRPDSGFKTFTGQVVSLSKWNDAVDYLGFYDVEPEELVVVAPQQDIINEYRCIVVDNKVVSATQYRNEAGIKISSDVPDRVLHFSESVLDNVDYQPERAWCMDVCEVDVPFSDIGTLHVLEVGCFSCAGLYAAPKENIVREVSRVALEEYLSLQP